jgi:hypothetical protein
MSEMIYSLFLIGLGILSLFLSIKSLLDPAFAKKYFETSPKAWVGRKIFGAEKASIINRKIIFPLGIIFGFGFIFAGILLVIL